MSMPSVRPSDVTGQTREEPDGEEYSPAFAAWALLLTLGVLTVSITAVWVLAVPVLGTP